MYTKEDIEKAKQYLDNEGYGTGSNFTLNSVANLMAEYAAKNCVIPAVIHWVASAERIPENRQKVLCYNGFRMIENSWCMHTDQDAEWFKRTFTHWTEDVLPPCV